MRLQEANANLRKRKLKGEGVSALNDKLKASNFPCFASQNRHLGDVGFLQYKSRYEGSVSLRSISLYGEVFDGGLKNKIEIQWSDIVAIKATFSDDGPETLDVVVIHLFNPQMGTQIRSDLFPLICRIGHHHLELNHHPQILNSKIH